MKKYYQLQNILFCDNDRLEAYWEMFYHSSHPVFDREKQHIVMGAGQVIDFCTYFNSISLRKWKHYTYVKNLFLKLQVLGQMEILLTGYEKKDNQYIRKVLYRQKVDAKEMQEITLEYPENSLMLAGFEIHTLGICRLFKGEYGTLLSEEIIRHVSLHLVTTTFKKEEYIIPNINLLKEYILSGNDALAENLWVHVVDNGRTLNAQELEDSHVMIHPNLNTGGSGGFTRGMMEAFDHKEKPTHVLLMDDDVMILPESLRRTYSLLSILRPEYDDYYISGAMLYYEQMNCLYEDTGYVHSNGEYGPLKYMVDTRDTEALLRSEEIMHQPKNAYAGWWYCCIPASVIDMENLPLPLFVRGDDVEYSLRNKAKFITLSGICIWHMGFTNKFNGAMEFYQVHRNSLIIQAASGICLNVDFMERIRKLIRVNLLRFDYDGAELLMDAVEDYLKGYKFLMENQGEKLLKEKAAKNEKMKPVSEFPEAPGRLFSVYEDQPRSFLETFLYRITYNGHFWPDMWLKKQPGVAAYDWFYSPHRYFFRKKLLVINPHMQTGAYREMDKKRFYALLKRRKKLMEQYKHTHQKVDGEYRRHKAELTSAAFWRKYLELDK